MKDNSNNIRAKYVYDAWGNHKVYNASGVEQTSSTFVGNINPIRYRGYYYDTESDMYYCKSRYYKPQINRWINMDDISYLDKKNINGFNLYAYCNNNPVNYSDKSGHNAIKLFMRFAVKVVSTILRSIHYSRIAKGEEYKFKDNYNQYTQEELEHNFITGVYAHCHQFSAKEYGDHIKIMTIDGKYEAIYDKNTGNLVTDPRDIGTYNYYDPTTNAFMHGVFDVVPWVFWGNSLDDSTEWYDRLGYMIYGVFD